MGSIIGGVVSGVGGLIGSSMQSDAAAKAGRYQLMASTQAQNDALLGYRWLMTTGDVNPYLENGKQGVAAEQGIMDQEGANTATIQALLGLGQTGAGLPGAPGGGGKDDAARAAQSAFNNYLNSTGYAFQMQQGQDAVTGSAAAKGLLNSGATLKALTRYGQDLGSTYFNNYLGQINSANGQLGGLFSQANTRAGNGLSTIGLIAAAGSQGGAGAANAAIQGGANAGNAFIQQGNAQANGIAGAAGALGKGLSNYFGGTGANAPTGNGLGFSGVGADASSGGNFFGSMVNPGAFYGAGAGAFPDGNFFG